MNIYCVGGRHISATIKVYGDINPKGSEVLIGYCSVGDRKKSMTASDNRLIAKGLGDFFKNLGKKGLNESKKMAKNVLKNRGRAFDIKANVASAVASGNPKAVLSTLPVVINFYHTGKGLYLGRFL